MPTQEGPTTRALRDHLDKAGHDPRAWSDDEKTTYSDLSNGAMREQNGLPASPPAS